jgi:hypothetical protein
LFSRNEGDTDPNQKSTELVFPQEINALLISYLGEGYKYVLWISIPKPWKWKDQLSNTLYCKDYAKPPVSVFGARFGINYLIDYANSKNFSVGLNTLLSAVEGGHCDTISKLIEENPEKKDDEICISDIDVREFELKNRWFKEYPSAQPLIKSINCKRWDCTRLLMLHEFRITKGTLDAAFEHSTPDIFEELFMRYIDPAKFDVCISASAWGNCDLLEHFVKNGKPVTPECSLFASKNGSLSCLKFLVESNYIIHPNCEREASAFRHFDVLEYLMNFRARNDSEISNGAANAGNIELLKKLYALSYPIAKDIMLYAFHAPTLDCFKFLIENGVPYFFWMSSKVASRGDVEVMKFLIDRGLEIDPEAYPSAAYNDGTEIIKLLIERKIKCSEKAMRDTATSKKGECFQLLASAFPELITYETFLGALFLDRVDNLKFLIGMGIQYDRDIALHSVEFNAKECLKYLLLNGHTLPKTAIYFAINGRMPEILKILLEVKGQNTGNVIERAIDSNFPVGLKILIDAGFPFGKYEFKKATFEGNKECMELLIDSGCLIDEESIRRAFSNKMSELFKNVTQRNFSDQKDLAILFKLALEENFDLFEELEKKVLNWIGIEDFESLSICNSKKQKSEKF